MLYTSVAAVSLREKSEFAPSKGDDQSVPSLVTTGTTQCDLCMFQRSRANVASDDAQ